MKSRELTLEKPYMIKTRSSDKSSSKPILNFEKITSCIKRPRNPYILFIMDSKEKASKGKIKCKELIKRLGEIWRNMTSEDKKP